MVEEQVKRKSVFAAVIIMMLLTNYILGSDSTLVNGSFEADGKIDDLRLKEPNGWTDVNLPINKFGGWVNKDWVTNGNWNLAVYSYPATFNINDRARVAQYVYLTDVNAIWFDLRLSTQPSYQPWDPNICSVVLEIDNEPVWESPNDKVYINGPWQYRNQMYSVNPMYNDNILHKLALILRINVAGTRPLIYIADWDNIGFDYACGDYDFPTGDFNHDCVVDFRDYAVLAGEWLNGTDPCNPNHICDLYKGDESQSYGVINFRDFAIYAEGWDCNMVELGNFAAGWLYEVDTNDPYNLYHGDDVEPTGIIDLEDLAIFGENWLEPNP
jgi:hypothetical protein